MKKNIKIKRIYDTYDENDGFRVLVDRLWPRGIKKEKAHIHEWIKEIAPSEDLRKWFDHDPSKWEQFKKRYFKELDKNRELCKELIEKYSEDITLVFAAKDEQHNNAIILKEYLNKIL